MWMQYFSEFLILATVHFLAVLLPGPDFIVTIRNSLRYGYGIGCMTAIGIGIGISIHVFYTLIGVGIVIQHSSWLMSIFRVLGAFYLIYLGWNLLHAKGLHVDIFSESNQQGSLNKWKAFRMGFMTNTLNPKATIFFLSIFTTLVSVSTPMKVQVFYGVWMCTVNALWFIVVAKIFSYSTIRNQFLKHSKVFERIMGLILIVLALSLILKN
ncbi:LysE family translocator [Acinetobacter johnsonii]|jgi:RhtB (resistance to homoserine/threonine) family protein|uniref:LysE family translocator n=2 Tax=Acinetobacter johnsonii TaxID=40214 RepID=A0A2W5R5B7_ACIJO|nr:LysE family translocator [Acinetobacter johnsonii]EEY94630.1 Homoserine/Threonine efflux protein [Acinetobacter johnsonii SH046]PZQ85178.1 MAG: LysE family translocator [Acinetobacter johnsonii]QPS02404.1 LysE family translocator [Acinetobacter johnsonii]SSX66815.1 lysine exporter protein [Acinetobacter johnsonii]